MRSLRVVLITLTLLGTAGAGIAAAVDDGSGVFGEACSGCHTQKVRPLDNVHLTREQWKSEVERMIDQGAEVPKGKMQELLDYLVSTHGPVSTAPAEGGKK